MGHKINPVMFRLGVNQNWQFNLKEKKNWITNYLVYQLVSNQLYHYTTRYFSRKKLRNRRSEQGLITMRGERQLRKNSFVKNSLLFSHLTLGSKNSELKINCFLYDYKLRKQRYKKEFNKFKRYNQFYSNSHFIFFQQPRPKYFRKKNRNMLGGYRIRRIRYWVKRKLIKNFWLYNFNLRSQFNSCRLDSKLFSLIKIWLRLSKLKFNKNQKVFFYNVFSYLLRGLLPWIKKVKATNLEKRLKLLLFTINFNNFKYKLINSLFFLDQFRKKYLIFKAVSKSISQNLRSMLPETEAVLLKYHAIREKNMTSSLICNLIVTKLGQYFRINRIVYPVCNWIKRHKNVLGYRIIISGRLTRRERATHMIKSGKSMPLSSLKHQIDYHQEVKIMKFGMVGIKVYLFLKKRFRTSYYFFKFSSKFNN